MTTQTQERAFNMLRDLLQTNFPDAPPETMNIVKDSPMLTKLAELSKTLLLSAATNILGEEKVNLVDLAIRHMLNEYSEDIIASKGASLALNSSKQDELHKTKLELSMLQEENKDLKDRILALEEHAQSCQAELESVRVEKEKALQNKLILAAKKRNEMSLKNAEILNITDQLLATQNELRITMDKNTRLNSQIKDLESEITKITQEKQQILDKSKQKSSTIRELRTQVENNKIISEQLEKAKSELNSMNKKQSIEDTYRMASAKMQDVVKNLNEEIIPLRQSRDEALVLLQKQMLLIKKYESSLELQDDKIRLLNAKISELTDTINQNDDLIQESNENHAELEDLRQLVIDCITAFQPNYIITAEQLPETISSLCHNDPTVLTRDIDFESSELNSNHSESVNLIDSLTKFCLDLINGKVDLKHFTSSYSPIVVDENLKLDAMSKLNQIREDYLQIIDNNEEDPIIGLLNKKDFNIQNQNELSISLISTNCASKVLELSKKSLEALYPAKRQIPLICSNEDLPSEISRFVIDTKTGLEKLVKQIMTVVHIDSNSLNEIDTIKVFVDICSKLIQDLDQKVRPILGFAGKVVEIPSQIGEYIDGLLKREEEKIEVIKKENSLKIKELNSKLADVKQTNEALNDKLRKIAFELRTVFNELEKTRKQNSALTEQLEVATDRIEIEKGENTKIQERQNQYVSVIKSLQSEVKRQEALLKERQEVNERRIEQMLENERQLRFDEVDALKRKQKAELSELQNQVGRKREKLSEIKVSLQKLREEKEETEHALKMKITELEQENESTIRMAEDNDVLCKSRIEELMQLNTELEGKVKSLALLSQRNSPALRSSFRTDKNIQTEKDKAGEGKGDASKWKEWAKDLVVKRISGRQTNRELPDEELMRKISDVVFNMGNQKKLVQIVEDLRQQKALANAAQNAQKTNNFGFISLVRAVKTVLQINTKATTPQKNSILSPRIGKYPSLQKVSAVSTPNSSPKKTNNVIIL
ncbi:hypothetical protein TVAG_222340 [Trichomonas vaginalis G3]|uniref:Uncharacterized protein n=1 Tax=Trichomonas vaginalis (strain ATCC PRA-98 / G3) TaxID=412133 RepID=A2G0P0_TRIV3|nr:hypothetical protein TVAGG3_0891990 [Trichomonas vaginalis G3]EAX89280.1 hypothetical protein TVAG_222340 [Trichomonas vaginalis G3]KAI5502787.1 hypothetical protein TVAGG3_0891990 [Trichomonas vaginalis G3]|eukprot:XP_001302210.1 hypothetical protein [Trichomonas vaginalis G3]